MRNAATTLILAFTLAIPRLASADPQADEKTRLTEIVGPLEPGARIRITAPEPFETRFTGWFSNIESDSVLRVHLDRDEAAVPVHLRQIGTIETNVGTRRHWLIGSVIGLAVGTAIGAASVAGEEDPTFDMPPFGRFRMVGVRQTQVAASGIAGLLLGGVVGYFIKSEQWRPVARVD